MYSPLFYKIIVKTNPFLKNKVGLTINREHFYGMWTQTTEISFPQEYRNEILMILSFCGVYVEKEIYDSSGIGYFTIFDREIEFY